MKAPTLEAAIERWLAVSPAKRTWVADTLRRTAVIMPKSEEARAEAAVVALLDAIEAVVPKAAPRPRAGKRRAGGAS